MRTTTPKLALLLVLGLGAVPASVEAQDGDAGREAEASADSLDDAAEYRFADDFTDLQVFNAVGAEIGEISRIIIRNDRVTHAIISIGGLVGLGGTDIVVPFDALSFEQDRATMDTLATADQVEELTRFDAGLFGLSE